MDNKELTTRGDKEIALYELETRFALATRQRELLENYIRERLQPNRHFYTVDDDPGRKPSLAKEGAELICLPHNLKGHYEWLAGLENPPMDDSPYQITMKCIMENNGKFEGEGIGSASSMVTKKDGTRVQRQKDPGLRHNATIKMACKSAYIAATLNSTAASEFFTQDLEDDHTKDFTKPSKDKTKGRWCEEHNCAFTEKKGKGGASFWSHKTKDGWCNEREKSAPKEQSETPPDALESMGEPFEEESSGNLPEQREEVSETLSSGKRPRPERDPATIRTIADLMKACHTDFGMRPEQVIKDLGYSRHTDIAESPKDCYIKIVASRCE